MNSENLEQPLLLDPLVSTNISNREYTSRESILATRSFSESDLYSSPQYISELYISEETLPENNNNSSINNNNNNNNNNNKIRNTDVKQRSKSKRSFIPKTIRVTSSNGQNLVVMPKSNFNLLGVNSIIPFTNLVGDMIVSPPSYYNSTFPIPINISDTTNTRWRQHLLQSSQELQGLLYRHVNIAHQNAILCAAVSAIECVCCYIKKYKLDVLQLLCCPERRPRSCPYVGKQKPPHVVCFTCMGKLTRQAVKNLQKMEIFELQNVNKRESTIKDNISSLHYYYDNENNNNNNKCAEAEATQFLKNLTVQIIPCPLCKSPNVIKVHTVFKEGLQRSCVSGDGTITQYQIAIAATKVLQENYTVEEVYENQRRHIFGAFTHANLLTFDFRGPFSTEDGCEVPHIYNKPNRRWVYIEINAPDTTLLTAGERGWMYRHNWSNKLKDYNSKVNFFHLVRTRRLLHTRVRISEDVRSELMALHDEVTEETMEEAEGILFSQHIRRRPRQRQYFAPL